MDTAINNTNNYWSVLKDLSKEAKLDLIARLSNSLLHKDKEKVVSADSFYGVWKDGDLLNETIKSSRKFKDDIKAF